MRRTVIIVQTPLNAFYSDLRNFKLSKPAVGRFGIGRHPYTESCIDQFPCVCVYDYSSQTTGPICIKITLVDRTYHGVTDCYRLQL